MSAASQTFSPVLQAHPLHKNRATTTPKRHSNGPFLPKQIKLYKLHFAAFLHEPWRSETDFAGKSSGSWIITFAVFPAIQPVTLLRPFPIYSGGTAWDLHPTSLLNPDTHRAKGYLRVHYSTIPISFQAAVFVKLISCGFQERKQHLLKSQIIIYKDNNTCYNAIEKQNTWEFAGVRAHRAGEKGTE